MFGTIQDVTDIVLMQQQLHKLATTDELTGAVNRRHLFHLAEQLRQLALRYHSPFSVIFYDLDHFKNINDSHGHGTGDEVLRQVTEVVQSMLRDTDILARYGGEEFCILAPETTCERAEILAERIRQQVAAQQMVISSDLKLQVTISIGIAEFLQTDSISTVIDRADQGVYQAKRNGRNCVVAR